MENPQHVRQMTELMKGNHEKDKAKSLLGICVQLWCDTIGSNRVAQPNYCKYFIKNMALY